MGQYSVDNNPLPTIKLNNNYSNEIDIGDGDGEKDNEYGRVGDGVDSSGSVYDDCGCIDDDNGGDDENNKNDNAEIGMDIEEDIDINSNSNKNQNDDGPMIRHN